ANWHARQERARFPLPGRPENGKGAQPVSGHLEEAAGRLLEVQLRGNESRPNRCQERKIAASARRLRGVFAVPAHSVKTSSPRCHERVRAPFAFRRAWLPWPRSRRQEARRWERRRESPPG